jgi:hypothetical protein
MWSRAASAPPVNPELTHIPAARADARDAALGTGSGETACEEFSP